MTNKNLLTTAPLLMGLIAALPTLSFTAFAQEASSAANADVAANAAAQASAPADQLANRYAELVGSAEAATELVGELHAGTTQTAGMAYGEIDNALAVTEALMAVDAGAGRAGTELETALDNVLDLRATGMGWGEVAHTLGLDLGQAVGISHQADAVANGAVNATVNGTARAGASAGAAGADVANAALDTVDTISNRVDTNIGAGTSADARVRASSGQDTRAEAGAGAGARIDAGARGNAASRPQLTQPVRGLLGGGR